ncbi:MAG TPA: acyl-CoA dehydrogenase family protein [Syntrophomonadaceae bacterium]|nr:acyl-CoA dehydrogenase family protein [Syntrophomonadaceae bacterium]
MSLPDRFNPYNFQEFLDWREQIDFYDDDPFIQKTLKYFVGKEWQEVDKKAREISTKASYRWNQMAQSIAYPEKRPYMMHYDGHLNRIDRIVRPHEVELMEKEIFSEGLFSSQTSQWEKLIKMYLIYQNGEACVACPITCTEGMVEVVERFADTPELKNILQHCKEGINGDFAIGAQYISEIQGGSDIPANLLEAVKEDGKWRLYGTKFFCSATHADYSMVTAKPQGEDKVALFIVPSWLLGNKEKEIRNGYTIDRIKWKMGTSELTTAELTYDGALAYQVGPLDRGVANIVGIVLSYSRLTVGLSAAAFMTRAVREASGYIKFREAFGQKISNFPLVIGQLANMEKIAQRTTAGAFKLYKSVIAQGGLAKVSTKSATLEERKQIFNTRELIMLQKITASYDSTDVIRTAMSLFGGHGVIEDFSVLPRLYRDSAVNELWEGPRNVLLMQIHRDMQRASSWYEPEEFVKNILKGGSPEVVDGLAAEMAKLVAWPNLLQTDAETIGISMRWDEFCHELFHAFQDIALAEVENG